MIPQGRIVQSLFAVLIWFNALFVRRSAAFASSTFQPAASSNTRTSHLKLHATNSKSPFNKLLNIVESAQASVEDYLFMRPSLTLPAGMRRVKTQFIAALGDPKASSGNNAQEWGIWRIDPGPRGVYLSQFSNNMKTAPAGWKFDPSEFWIEEYGRIMEKPDFPLPPGKYLVTGGRETTTVLTIDAPTSSGTQNWKLEDGTLFDVTHLPCRAAKYCPASNGNASPADAKESDFPVTPGATMPPVEGCTKQDYAVLFVLAVDEDG